MTTALGTPAVLTRLRNVPTRTVPALFTFGGMLGLPSLLVCAGAFIAALDVPAAGAVLLLLAGLLFAGMVIAAWVLIFQASDRLQRAEQALYSGDLESATREALFVTRTVFRSDYQTGALFTLALAAERLGAFSEAGTLFSRALGMIPAMAAQRPGRRANALFAAHAAINFAGANDLVNSRAMLARSYNALGVAGQPGALDALLDDSYMGAVGINTLLVSLENRREPRPLAVLASMLIAYKDGQLEQVIQTYAHERESIERGLAPHERALAERIHREALRIRSSAGPHRSPGQLAPGGPSGLEAPEAWATLVLP